MPDLTIIPAQQCTSGSVAAAEVDGYELTGLGSERTWPACTCPAYKFKKAGVVNFGGHMVPNPCKHIKKYEESICGWHEVYSLEGTQTKEQREHMICPLCGGPTEWVQVGV